MLQGVPKMIYADSGPISKSRVYRDVISQLGVDARVHMPKDSDGRRVTARSKGKVERPFRTRVKDAHETLYHFHQPETEAEANLWLGRFLATTMSAPSGRGAFAIGRLARALAGRGIRRCAHGNGSAPSRVSRNGAWSVSIACGRGGSCTRSIRTSPARRSSSGGPVRSGIVGRARREAPRTLRPAGGPIPLHRYRSFKKTKTEERSDRIEALAATLGLPRAALSGTVGPTPFGPSASTPSIPFKDPDPFQEFQFPTVLAAKLAIADYLATPLARLSKEDRAYIDHILAETLDRRTIIDCVRGYFRQRSREPGGTHAD